MGVLLHGVFPPPSRPSSTETRRSTLQKRDPAEAAFYIGLTCIGAFYLVLIMGAPLIQNFVQGIGN